MSNQLPVGRLSQIYDFQCIFAMKFEWIFSCISLSRYFPTLGSFLSLSGFSAYSHIVYHPVCFTLNLLAFSSPLTYACMFDSEFLLLYTFDDFIVYFVFLYIQYTIYNDHRDCLQVQYSIEQI